MSDAGALLIERPARLLVIVPRPGEPEVELGGTIARWVMAGTTARLLCATSGEIADADPTADPLAIATDAEERQVAAATAIGYEDVVFLHRPEGAVANDLALREQLVRQLRAFRPDCVAAPDPRTIVDAAGHINDADRRATGLALIDAIRPAGQRLAFRGLVSAGLEPALISRLLLTSAAAAEADAQVAVEDITVRVG